MPKFWQFKTIDSFTVSAGSTVEKTWTSDDDYIIHTIRLVETSGASLALLKTTITLSIAEEPPRPKVLTKDLVPGSVFTGYENQLPVLDIPLNKSEVIKFSFENAGTSDVTIYVVMELWK